MATCDITVPLMAGLLAMFFCGCIATSFVWFWFVFIKRTAK